MTRTTVAIFGLVCSSAAAVAGSAVSQSPLLKPSRAPQSATARLPPPASIRKLFVRPGDNLDRQSVKVGSLGAVAPVRRSHEQDHWLTCGMTVFLADPSVDPKSLKKHSSRGQAIRRVEPQICK